MEYEAVEVGIVVERRRLENPWVDHAWLPVAALAGAPAAAPWTVLDESPEATRYYAGSFPVDLFSTDTGSYRDNLASGAPGLWVVLRDTGEPPGIKVHKVTADPYEGETLTGPGSDIVEPVPMPAEVQERVAAFVAAHHVERVFVKRQRDRADPEALSVRQGGAKRREDEQ